MAILMPIASLRAKIQRSLWKALVSNCVPSLTKVSEYETQYMMTPGLSA